MVIKLVITTREKMILSENRLIFKDLENHFYYLNVNELFHVSKLFLKFHFLQIKTVEQRENEKVQRESERS